MSALVAYGDDSDSSDDDGGNGGGLVGYNDDDEEDQPDGQSPNDAKRADATLVNEGPEKVAAPLKKEGPSLDKPAGSVDEAIAAQVQQLINARAKGRDVNQAINARRNYKNPSMYAKFIDTCDIDETGTNCPVALFNPKQWTSADAYDALEKRHKAKSSNSAPRAEIHFVKSKVASKTETGAGVSRPRKRGSKWDKGSSAAKRI